MPLTCDAHPGKNTIEIVAMGPISETEVKVAAEKIVGFIDRHGQVNVIEIVRQFSGADPAAVWSDHRLDDRRGRFRRVAVVTEGGWTSPLARAAEGDGRMELRTFPMDRVDAARLWAHRDS